MAYLGGDQTIDLHMNADRGLPSFTLESINPFAFNAMRMNGDQRFRTQQTFTNSRQLRGGEIRMDTILSECM